ncbi:siderophore-interacting protein [Nocardioides insulae]|uniref:siderophore-interacting protein n=1 Tax=Nocardioides insulae TaxID=394734 RepID=UPI00068871B2|nr:siderophore-interacting protein [Nocardioides insulae]
MSNIKVTHADSGLIRARVVHSEQVTPHMRRVTLGGPDLKRLTARGFDQWVRLALPKSSETRFDNLADSFGVKGYVRFLTLPKATRPVIRNYTIREVRPDLPEVDIDFVCHGDEGFAGPWAREVGPGAEVAMIDQGCGWAPVPAPWQLLVADESGLPAIAGILRDLPRETTGHAFIELFDDADRQDCQAPAGVNVHWLTRQAHEDPGTLALRAVHELDFPDGAPYAFVVGEQALAAGVRRHLVQERGLPKTHVTFSGYWRRGKASPS